jgi:hypothetical protein
MLRAEVFSNAYVVHGLDLRTLCSGIGIFDKGMRLRLMFRCVNVYAERSLGARFWGILDLSFFLSCC